MSEFTNTSEVNLTEIEANIKRLRQSNTDKIKALQTATGQGIDPGAMAMLMMETFLETFLDKAAKMVYIQNLEMRKSQELDEALKAVRQAMITQGVTKGDNKIIVPR